MAEPHQPLATFVLLLLQDRRKVEKCGGQVAVHCPTPFWTECFTSIPRLKFWGDGGSVGLPVPPFRWPCVAMHCCLLWMGLFASSLWHSNMHIFWFIWSRLTLEFSCFKKRRAVPWNILNQTWNVYNWSRLQRSDIRKVNSQRIDRRNQMVYKFLNNFAFIFHCTVFYPSLYRLHKSRLWVHP